MSGLWPGVGRPGTGWLLSLGLAYSTLGLHFLLCQRKGLDQMLIKFHVRANVLLLGLLGVSEQGPQSRYPWPGFVSQPEDPVFFPTQGSSTQIMLSPFVTEICFLAMSICVPVVFFFFKKLTLRKAKSIPKWLPLKMH